ncbi:MAG: winged helix-turn-helix domain-containing protein [Quisquiliibacterium sp.]|jgi:molybdate transport system regulatory protein
MRANESQAISLRLRFAEHARLGPGKMALLEAVRRSGSIAQAAREMNMSLRRAWMLLDSVNAMFDQPSVIVGPGELEQAHCALTDFGSELLDAWEAASRESRASVERHFAGILARLRDLPASSPGVPGAPLPPTVSGTGGSGSDKDSRN